MSIFQDLFLPLQLISIRDLEKGIIGPVMKVIHRSFSYRKCEELIAVINLHYCSAVGLIHVGVLPKPDIYTYHRMVTGKKRARAKIPIVTHKRIRRASTLTVDGTQMSTSEE
jgi:hypothetical protein